MKQYVEKNIDNMSFSFTLIVLAENGLVIVSPKKDIYEPDETVELIPQPHKGYYFSGWSGDEISNRLVLNLTMDGNKTIIANFSTWQPPIGIPQPNFGIFESYRMYDDPKKRNINLTYKVSPSGGYYTHYIDNIHPDSTDENNFFGTVDFPRKTIPHRNTDGMLSAGSIVEIHGGPYTYFFQTRTGTNPEDPNVGWYGGRRLSINGEGSPEYPIFVRGINSPILNPSRGSVWIEATYLIVENMVSYKSFHMRPKTDFIDHVHHIAIRNNDLDGGTVSMGWPHGRYNHVEYRNSQILNDIIIYNNRIHDVGTWNSDTTNKDAAGIFPHINAKYIWAVDNHIYHIESDGIAVNCWGIFDDSNLQQPPMNIYIGRNNIHHCQENCFDAKIAYDLIVSQNTMHGIHKYINVNGEIRPTKGSDGTCIVGAHEDHGTAHFPYGERYWYMFNDIYDSDIGIRVQSSDNVYIIGNIFHDILSSYSALLENNGYSSGGIIQMWDVRTVTIVGNTSYNTDLGILEADYNPNVTLYVSNNIIGNLTNRHFEEFGINGYHIYIKDYKMGSRSILSHNLLFQDNNSVRIKWDSHPVDLPIYPEKDVDNNFRSDPQFFNVSKKDFHLQLMSPAKAAAISSGIVQKMYDRFENLYGLNIRKDIEGTPLIDPWGVGAYEYSDNLNNYNSSSSSSSTSSSSISSSSSSSKKMCVNYCCLNFSNIILFLEKIIVELKKL